VSAPQYYVVRLLLVLISIMIFIVLLRLVLKIKFVFLYHKTITCAATEKSITNMKHYYDFVTYHTEPFNNSGYYLLSRSVKIKIYRTITFPVVLYGCETWSVVLMKECRL
jgi:flagellar basal body-associated protein FliL